MHRNIEIKARVRNLEELAAKAERLAGSPAQILNQVDTFFNSPAGRFKLRTINDRASELIFYNRPSIPGPKLSSFFRIPIDDSASAQEMFAQMLGVRSVLRKRRRLYLHGTTRIHLDEVESLGNFMELEAVLLPSESPADGQRRAEEIMKHLGIEHADLLDGAYVDLQSPAAK